VLILVTGIFFFFFDDGCCRCGRRCGRRRGGRRCRRRRLDDDVNVHRRVALVAVAAILPGMVRLLVAML